VNEYVLDGRYALIERIASGGMGEVWRGVDQILGRPVAIKLLSAVHAGDEQFRARFRAEARYAASLSHPGIARVFDYGESSPLGGPYLVMDLVNGEPLSAILERVGRLPADATLDIVGQAARALDTAHQAGIVHRDIKPGNLLIMADGTTKITDFGIAKARALESVNLTATGIVMGTALYVSPEQATGSTVTGSSDVYSLGVVAYECLTGEPPFVADQPLAIAIMHKHDPVPPLPADVPKPVGDLVLSMLAKTPQGRPESALHVADRADVIREAGSRSGVSGPITADLPVVPDFPPTVGTFPDDSERTVGSRLGTRRLAAAGVGVALCGVAAIVVVVLMTAGGHPVTLPGKTKSPAQSASQVVSPATASVRTTTAGGIAPGTNLGSASGTSAASSAQPTPSRTSPKPTPDAPQTTTAPTVTASKSASTSTPATTPPTSSSPTTTPPTTPTTPTPTMSTATGAATKAAANEG
jgi:eukaryotic-like serine/threonine-protein kinase